MARTYLEGNKLRQLIQSWKDTHNKKDLESLTLMCRLMVSNIAVRYHHYDLPYDDLIQEGTLALLEAVESFKPENKYLFSNLAKWHIHKKIQDFIKENWSIVGGYIPINQFYEEMDNRLPWPDISLNRVEGQNYLIDESLSPEESAIKNHDDLVCHKWLIKQLKSLTPRECQVMCLRWLDDWDASSNFRVSTHRQMTLKTVGNKLKVTQERIRQIEQRAFRKLRHPSRKNYDVVSILS